MKGLFINKFFKLIFVGFALSVVMQNHVKAVGEDPLCACAASTIGSTVTGVVGSGTIGAIGGVALTVIIGYL